MLNEDNNEFVSFLASDRGQDMRQEDNDDYYIEHPTDSKKKKKMGVEKVFKKAKNIFASLKTDPSSTMFSKEKIYQNIDQNQNMQTTHYC